MMKIIMIILIIIVKRIPCRCPICELPLASAPLIARSFQQLLPLPAFEAP